MLSSALIELNSICYHLFIHRVSSLEACLFSINMCSYSISRPPPNYCVDADKGFNLTTSDETFVCQKKNHFQITTQISMATAPTALRTNGQVHKIDDFYLHFYGIKVSSLRSISFRFSQNYEPFTTEFLKYLTGNCLWR